MRTIDPELQARLDDGTTRMCRCWRVRRTDQTLFGFTDHDDDVFFDDTIFRASSGLDASALQTATGLSVDNAQAIGALSDASVNEDDIRAGKFDRAEIDHWLVDWERPNLRVLLFRGQFGEIRRSDGVFEVEFRGLAEKLNIPLGRSILKTCDRILGDPKCRADVTGSAFSKEAGALSESTETRVLSSDLAAFAPGWFRHGKLTWLAGENAGASTNIKTDTLDSNGVRTLDLWEQPAQRVKPGDRFSVVAGCDKRSDTCRAKFGNFLNFRGFPHIPGEDWVTAYPKDGVVHDGGSQHES